jgi:hypothetical protein
MRDLSSANTPSRYQCNEFSPPTQDKSSQERYIHNGKQRFKVHDGGRQFIEQPIKEVIDQSIRELIDQLLLERTSLTGITLAESYWWVGEVEETLVLFEGLTSKRVLDFAAYLENHAVMFLHK